MAKLTTGYFLEKENKDWVSQKAKEVRRSASWYLNDLITKLREDDHAGK